MSGELPSILVVTGPTASGKSALALRLAQALNGEIVSADSVQVYRGFDLGSAKPSAADLASIPHHLISIRDPEDGFSAGDFVRLADGAIREIHSRGKRAIVSGGTGLYIRALLHGLVDLAPDTEGYRVFSETLLGLQESEAQSLRYKKLLEVDPRTANRLSPNDSARVQRALTVALGGGGSMADHHDSHLLGERRYRALIVLLFPADRAELYRRIDARVLEMVEQGLERECRELLLSTPPTVSALGSIGYREMVQHINGECSLAEAVSRMQQSTRQFSKRQYTWWRNQPERLSWGKLPEQCEFNLAKLLDAAQSFYAGEPPFSMDFTGILPVSGAVHSLRL